MLRNSLLTVHLLGVVVWLGCGLYELFLSRELKHSRGTAKEVELSRLYVKYSAPVPVATILVAVTGVWMSIALGYGFFESFWLGSKQWLMLLVLVVFFSLMPTFIRLQKDVQGLPTSTTTLPESISDRFRQVAVSYTHLTLPTIA